MSKIKAYVTMILFFIIQITCADILNIANCVPNLLLVFCICFSVMNGLSIDGLILCAVCGLLCDIAGAFPWGVSSIAFVAIYLICSLVGSKFYRAKLPISMLFAFVITFLYESGGYLALMLSETQVGYGIAIVRLILPTCIYHLVLTPVLFMIMRHVLSLDPYADTDLN